LDFEHTGFHGKNGAQRAPLSLVANGVALTVVTTDELAFKGFASEDTSPLIKNTRFHQVLTKNERNC